MQRPERRPVPVAVALGALICLASAVAAQPPEAVPTPGAADAAQERATPPDGAPQASTADGSAEPSPSAIESVQIGGVESRTAALLLSGQTGGNLPGVMLLCQEPGASDEGRVGLRMYLELDGGTLLENAPPDRIPVAIYVYVLSEEGTVVGHLAEGMILRDPGIRAALHRSGLKFEGRLTLPPGTVSLRAMVRLYGTERFLLTRSEVHLSAPGSGEPRLSPPLFPDPEVRWVEVRQAGLPPGGCVDGLVPSAFPVLDVAHQMSFELSGDGWPEGVRLQLAVVDPSGREVDEPRFALEPPTQGSEGEAWAARGTIEPFDVPSGEYRLIAALRTPNGDELATRTLPVVLLPIPAAAPWAGLAELGEVPEAPAPTTPPEEPASSREMRRAYLSALELLATGDAPGARRAVAELEREAAAADPAKGLTELRKIEVKAASRLEKRVPRSLPPVVLLHRELYRTYTAYRESTLATHAWQLTAELAEMVAKGPPEVVPEGFAPGVLVSLASDLTDGAATTAAASLLERALHIDSRYEPALLGLAALQERTGHRGDAVDTLRRLVNVAPDHAEGRLRLGVDLAHLGRRGAAAKVLGELVTGSPPDWIRAVATQELARVQIADGKLGRARATLLAGIERQPENQRLKILLALVEDLGGSSAEAARTVARVEENAGRRFDTPRMRYSQWPDLGLFEIRTRLERVADERREDLREALGVGGE